MHEFGVGDFVCPGTRVGPAEDPKVRFTVGLGVVGGGEREVIVKEFAEFLGERGGELWTTIRDDFVVESKAKVDFMEKEGGHPFSGDGFLSGAENYPLRKAMVDHNQQGIKA